MSSQARLPKLTEVALFFVIFLAIIFSFIMFFELPIQLALFISWFIIIGFGLKLGHTYDDLQGAITNGIYNGLEAVLILISVGALIGSWIAGGVVPSLIYYGLEVIHPSIFLLATLIICAITSLATGTSWGTAGTAGIAMMGIGNALGIPLPMVAGAVLSGSYFGDKLSPLSDSTVLAASMAKVNVISHIRSMMYVSVPTFIITAVLFTLAGFMYVDGNADLSQTENVMNALKANFNIAWYILVPAFVVIGLLVMKKPSIPTISLGALFGIIWAIIFQGMAPVTAINTAYAGFSVDSGVDFIDNLLNRGGITSMLDIVLLIVLGLGFGGMLNHIGALQVIVNRFEKFMTNAGRLTASTVFVGFLGNLIGCAMYVSLILTPKVVENRYDDLDIDRTVLSRNTESGSTLTSGMVPWSDNGIYMSAVLGVSTLSYLPFMWLSFISIIITVIYGYTGKFIWYNSEKGEAK